MVDPEHIARIANGEFVWKVENFSALYQKMRLENTSILYSNAFYTSFYGYKVHV